MESRLHRLEAVQAMLLGIGQISNNCTDITEFIGAVHRALGRIMYAANFYVALCEREAGTLRFVYFVDEHDPAPDPLQDRVRKPYTGWAARCWTTSTRCWARS